MNYILTLIGSFFAGVAKLYAAYLQGRKDEEQKQKIEQLEVEVEAAKRLQNVKINTDVDAAIKRLRERGRVRD